MQGGILSPFLFSIYINSVIIFWCSKWLCYNAEFLKLCNEYNIVVDGNYCMRNVLYNFFILFFLFLLSLHAIVFYLPSW